ncbi:MAG: murein biosynthesis integral membrane protein MurJ [Chloroflexota bacterium]|nr:murein biosynthesis integral membrane protein MurJ [Chloroflexota bacterium]MDQ5867902.1 murein biosynthesis integral membrane protein MurJ [Chloroflexota bacterium]
MNVESHSGKETRRLNEQESLSLEATRALPLEEIQQPGQTAVGEGSVQPVPTAPPPAGQSMGRRLALNTLIVGGAFVLSRVLGLLREIVIADQFGVSGQKSAYDAAFGIPDTLFLLIIGGAVGSAFIPVFTRLVSGDEEARAWQLTSTLINASVVLLSLGGILMSFAAPALVAYLVAPGGEVDQRLVVDLTRVLLLSPLLMGLGGWAQGILNARQHFTLPALAPVAYNLSIIFGAVALTPYFGIYGVAWGVVLGAALHFGVQVPGLARVGMRYSLRLNLRDSGVGEVAKLLGPRIVGQAAFQANVIGARAIATSIAAGSVAAFNYAYLLMILPHGVFAMSLATVTFPTMAALFAEGNLEGVRTTLSRAVRVLLFLTLPSAAGMYALRTELVSALFQSGTFDAQSTEMVAGALGYFALGLVAYAVVEVVTRAFYALHDTATPVTIAIVTVALNLGLSALLVLGMGWDHTALALSLAVSTTVEMVLLWVFLSRKLPGWRLSNDGLLASTARSGLAALVMALALTLLMPLLWQVLGSPTESKLSAIILTIAGISIGAAIYTGTALLLRSQELGEAVRLVLKRKT